MAESPGRSGTGFGTTPTKADEVIRQYAATIAQARAAYENAASQLEPLKAELDSIPAPDDVNDAGPGETQGFKRAELAKRIAVLQKSYDDANTQYVTTLRQRAEAVLKAEDGADPATRARLEAQAKADTARAAQIEQEGREFAESAPERRQAAKDTSRLSKAKADEAELELALAQESAPERRAAAQAAVERARVDTARIQKETEQIGKPAPRTEAQAAAEKAGAAVATGTVQSQISEADSRATQAGLEVRRLEQQLAQMPSDDQARESTEIALQNARAARDNAQQDIEQKRRLAPIGVEQAGANLEGTRAGTDASRASVDRARLGPQYGQGDRIREIRAMIERGEIDRQQGLGMIRADASGTTPFAQAEADRGAEQTRTGQALSQRGQDVGFEQSRMGNFTSGTSAALNQFGSMNQDAQPGSDAVGKGFLAFMDLLQSRLGQYQAPAGVVPPAASPAQPAGMPASAAGQVTINIGGGGTPATPAAAAAVAPNTVADPNTWLSKLPQTAAPQMATAPAGGSYSNPAAPATPADVDRLWGVGGGAVPTSRAAGGRF